MHGIDIYETPSGNRPLEKYFCDLVDKHKDDEIAEIKLYIKKLEQYGFEINTKFKKNAIKYIRDQIYELRPSRSRVFFFLYTNGVFVLLHAYEKKANKTDPNEIEKAIKERNSWMGRQK